MTCLEHRWRRVALFVLAMTLALLPACAGGDDDDGGGAAACVAPDPAPPAGMCDGVLALDPAMPGDVAMSPDDLSVEDAQRMFNCLSWKTFVALNWPARDDCRGTPDVDASFGTPERLRVWESYKEVFEVFQDDIAGWDPSGQEWHDSAPDIRCSDEAGDRKVVYLENKSPHAIDSVTEFEQAFATSFGRLTDQAGNLVRYEIRFNRDQFEFLKTSGAAITGSYSYGGPILTEGETFTLPDNRTGFSGTGALEIKASWKELTAADDPGRYYTQEVLIFDEEADPTCRVATLGLLGMHIAHKTYFAPQWAWATFEHVDNTPPANSLGDGRPYSLFSAECAAQEPADCWAFQPPITDPGLVCCPNLELNTALLPGFSTQTTRLDPIVPVELNETFRQLFEDEGSPFQHYQLINTQFTLGGRDPANPERVRRQFCNPNGPWAIPPAESDCFTQVPDSLRNTSMETFMASYGTGTIQQSADSCLNCHAAGGVDSSYIWLDAKLEPIPIEE